MDNRERGAARNTGLHNVVRLSANYGHLALWRSGIYEELGGKEKIY
jgi:hypothetical protein